jgi:hypothetical protein
MSKINIDQKSKPIRKYAGRTIALKKQNYKTSKIATARRSLFEIFYLGLFWKVVSWNLFHVPVIRPFRSI